MRAGSADEEDLTGDTRLHLLGCFELVVAGARPHVPRLAQRLAAFLALRGGQVGRSQAADVLLPDVDHDHALASLRTALWRLRGTAPGIVESAGSDLRSCPHTVVDLRETEALALHILRTQLPREEALCASDRLSRDLLPDWDDEWLVFERERFRDLRVHALERLCEQLSMAGDHADAVRCGLLAVQAEPLRESAHRALMRAHVAEGNRARALAEFRSLERLLEQELHVQPSPATIDLVRELLGTGPVGVAETERPRIASG